VLLSSCNHDSASEAVELSDDEIKVIQAVISHASARRARGADLIVVGGAPLKGQTFLDDVPSQYQEAWRKLYEDVDVDRCVQGLLNAGFTAMTIDSLLSQVKRDSTRSWRDRRWYIKISPPVVDGHRAVISCYWESGNLGGESRIFMLTRTNMQWRIKRDRLISVS
jgi:hypothetical protein